MRVIINSQPADLSYQDICGLLKINPGVHFVKVTRAGSIDFTIGKPDEIAYLIRRVADAGMKISGKFYKWARRQGFGCPLMYYDKAK